MLNLAKGAVVLSTIDFLRAAAGQHGVEQTLRRLDPSERRQIEQMQATDAVDLEQVYRLWHAADDVLGANDPDWMERAGAYSIESAGVQLYGGIVRKPTPHEFLDQRVSLFRLFYQSGSMEVVEQERTRAVLRLVGFPTVDTLFCRRQTGGLRRALELTGGGAAAEARHVRCAGVGDAFCEWELRWTASAADRPAAPARRTRPAPA